MTSVSVKNISVSYKTKSSAIKALDKITFDINKGELFGLIGPDGAGKTSLFRVLTTLQIPDKGEATVENLDVVDKYREIRDIIGYMPGRFSLYQDLTIEENLSFFADVFDTSLEENYGLIKEIYVQIEPFKKRRAGKLSGGMKQKLALCCALIHKPTVLFLDEPTTGVDPVSRGEFWEMLYRIKENGITIMVSTPYMDEASKCDRIALIQSGKILNINTPREIINSYPAKLYSIKSENNYHLLETLRMQDNIESCYISGESLHAIFKGSDLSVNNKTAVIKEIDPTIEDCFIKLMNTNESN